MKGLNTEDLWTFFIGKNQHCRDNFVPLRRTCKNIQKPKWMDGYCVRKVKKKYQTLKRFTFSHSYTDYENYCKIRNSVTKAVKFAKKKYQKGLAASIKTSPKSFYGHVKEETKSKSTIGDLRDKDGDLQTED